MSDWIVLGAVVILLAGIVFYVVKAKKSGKKCIGCPDGGSCGSCSGTCSCY